MSSSGKEVSFVSNDAVGPWRTTSTDLFDVQADYIAGNGAVLGFADGLQVNKLSVRLVGGSLEERDELFDVLAYNLANETPGKIYTGAWYCPAYIIGAAVDRWHISEGALSCDLEVLRCSKRWTRDLTSSYTRRDHGAGLNFPFDFPFNFATKSSEGSTITNPSALPAPISLRIYGPAENPRVSIGGNAYMVDASVRNGGQLLIDGQNKTITLYDEYGNAENAFGKRRGIQREGSGSYCFHRIEQGIHTVEWDGTFAFDVTVFETREERRWA